MMEHSPYSFIYSSLQGTIIGAGGKKNAMKHLKNLKEGETVRIMDFTVEETPIPKYTKTRVNHKFKLVLLFRTKFLNVRPDAFIHTSGFRLTPFDELIAHDTTFFVGM